MKRMLLLVPEGNGPGNGKKWNTAWPGELEKAVDANLWKLVTPGVLLLAAMVDPSEYKVDLVDETFQSVDENIDYDIVGMYTVTSNVMRTYRYADAFRSRSAHVVLGGVHASVCPEEAGRHADTVLVGECEYIWPEFLKDFRAHRTKKRYVQPVGTVDINDAPVPAFDLLPPQGRRLIPLQTARGCPHSCSFCNVKSLYGKKYRPKKLDRVKNELQAVMNINPRATLYFTDDNLFYNVTRSRRFLDMLDGCGYRLNWYANSDLGIGRDEDLIKAAYKSGCRQVLIGFESLNRANLDGIDEDNFKHSNFNSYREIIERIQSNGIAVIGSFIIGLEQDVPGTFDQLADFIDKSNLYGASITVSTPYPGTKLFGELRRDNGIATYDWDEYTIFQPVIKHRHMSRAGLNEGYTKLLLEINAPRNIMRRREYFKNIIAGVRTGRNDE